MTFTEHWFSADSQRALEHLYDLTRGLEGDIVEIGSWQGRSTVALANACHPEKLYAVDTWLGSPGEESWDLAQKRDVYQEFIVNISEMTRGNVVPRRMNWRGHFGSMIFADHPVKFCFVDAEHSYEEVRDNIAEVLPRLVPGGVICGDDLHHEPVHRAVLEAFPDAKALATIWFWQKPHATLAGRFAQLLSTPGDMQHQLARLYSLVLEHDAQHVIELGTRTGVSTIALLHALEVTGGHLTSVDVSPRPEIGEWPHWDFRQGDDLDTEIFADLEFADIVLIDTSHTYEQTLTELTVYRHLVKPGGVIALHDVLLEHPEDAPRRPAFPVRIAIEDFCEDNALEWSITSSVWPGLAEVRIPQ